MYNYETFKKELINFLTNTFPGCEVKQDTIYRNGLAAQDVLYFTKQENNTESVNRVGMVLYTEKLFEDYTECNDFKAFEAELVQKLTLDQLPTDFSDLFTNLENYLVPALLDDSVRPYVYDYCTKSFKNFKKCLFLCRFKEREKRYECMYIKPNSLDTINSFGTGSKTEDYLWTLAQHNLEKLDYDLIPLVLTLNLALGDELWTHLKKDKFEDEDFILTVKDFIKNVVEEEEKLITDTNNSSDEDEEDLNGDMFILKNKKHNNTTMALLDTKLLVFLTKIFDSGFLIIPSSIEELILVPMAMPKDSALAKIKFSIRDVNSTLENDLIFTDTAFYFSKEEMILKTL